MECSTQTLKSRVCERHGRGSGVGMEKSLPSSKSIALCPLLWKPPLLQIPPKISVAFYLISDWSIYCSSEEPMVKMNYYYFKPLRLGDSFSGSQTSLSLLFQSPSMCKKNLLMKLAFKIRKVVLEI